MYSLYEDAHGTVTAKRLFAPLWHGERECPLPLTPSKGGGGDTETDKIVPVWLLTHWLGFFPATKMAHSIFAVWLQSSTNLKVSNIFSNK